MSLRSSSVLALLFSLLPGCMMGAATDVSSEEALVDGDAFYTGFTGTDAWNTDARRSADFTGVATDQGSPRDTTSRMGCVDGTIEQVFDWDMFGCGGRVAFDERAESCSTGWHVCSAEEWVDRSSGQVPVLNYWTADALGWSTAKRNIATQCVVTDDLPVSGVSRPMSCPGDAATASVASPMRVCAPGGVDRLGNECDVFGCTLESGTVQSFGGCGEYLATAGALCCR